MRVDMVPVADLREAPENPRVISGEAVDVVAAAIERFGFLVPLVAALGGEVVCGHARLRAARQLGLESVPCVLVDNLTPAQVREFRVVENATHDRGGVWDVAKLDALIDELSLERWFPPRPEPPPPAASEPAPSAPDPDPVAPVDPDPVVRLAVRGALLEDVERVLGRAVDEPDGGAP